MHAWDDWQIFLATAQARSMSRSARAMNLDPSTVSRRLAALEERLGQTLFLRSRRGLELTPAAARLLPVIARAGAALEEAERMVSWSSGPPRGTVRIATFEPLANYMLVPALPSLAARHPHVQIELLPDEALADLAARECDVALRLVPPGDSELIAKAVDSGPLRAYVSSRKRRRSAGTSPADVRWIGWDDARSSQPEHRWMAAHRVPVVFKSSRATTMIEAALAGLGAVLLPSRFGDRIAGLERIEVDRLPSERVTLWLVTPRALRREPVIECVWEWLLELFGPDPAVRAKAPPPKRARAARSAKP